jgi:hypothetical protein
MKYDRLTDVKSFKSVVNPLCILDQNSSQMSVRVILRYEKLYREQVINLKFLFSIQILLISIVKFTRIDRISSKYTTAIVIIFLCNEKVK